MGNGHNLTHLIYRNYMVNFKKKIAVNIGFVW